MTTEPAARAVQQAQPRAKKTQRNAVRSERLIKKAFAKLLHTKEFSKITVSDIVKEAEICRGTFYAHYIDINDLYEQLEAEIIHDVMQYIDEVGVIGFLDNPKPTVDFCLTLIEGDKEYYRNLLLNESALSISEDIIRRTRDRFVKDLTAAYRRKTDEETKTFLIFAAGGVAGLFTRWLKNDVPMETPKVAALLCNMISACKFAFVNETLFI